jgi:hypothetical protein
VGRIIVRTASAPQQLQDCWLGLTQGGYVGIGQDCSRTTQGNVVASEVDHDATDSEVSE